MDSKEIGKSESPKPTTGMTQGDATWTLPETMTGRVSPAKAVVGDTPVLVYIASIPEP